LNSRLREAIRYDGTAARHGSIEFPERVSPWTQQNTLKDPTSVSREIKVTS